MQAKFRFLNVFPTAHVCRKEAEVKRSTIQSHGKNAIFVGTHPALTFTASNLSANPILICYTKFLGN
jgi:hypothetical protein